MAVRQKCFALAALLLQPATGWLAAAPGAWLGAAARQPRRTAAPLRAEADGETVTKPIDEIVADAELYEGDPIVDPYYQHPDTLPQLHEWTAEEFHADLAAGGHAEWEVPAAAFVFVRSFADDDRTRALRKSRHLDHLFWARESGIVAAEHGGARVHASQLLRDEANVATASLVAVLADDAAGAEALVRRDPLAPLFAKTDAYHWTIADDPYLQTDVWPEGMGPFAMLRLDDAAGTAKRGETRERHLSFLRKTARCIRAGPLRPLGDAGGAPVGSLVYSFHEDRARALEWAKRDPYVEAGVFTDEAFLCAPYNDLDVAGAQTTLPSGMREMADPLLARLVDAGLVELPERVVERIERDPETGALTHYNITTTDPRLESNVNIDADLMARMASTPKAVRAARKAARAKAAEAEEAEFEADGFAAGEEDAF